MASRKVQSTPSGSSKCKNGSAASARGGNSKAPKGPAATDAKREAPAFSTMDARFDGGCRREEELDGAAQYQSIHRVSVRMRSALRIEPVAPGEQPGERVDENAHLRRQMLTVRIERRDRELGCSVVPQQGHEGTGSKLLVDVERRNERQPKAGDNYEAPQHRVGCNEVSRDAHRERLAVWVGEAPFVSERVEGVANAVVG